MIAIVGRTGAGKTTLINLLERFYEIEGGSICIDGVDTRNMTPTQLRERMGMVLQDTWLFSGSIYDNIKFGNDQASDEEIYAAAKAAFAADFIQKLPGGYATILNEDADNISQGQRQLITIARAFVSDPEILILDEATSNVDSRTEMIIQSAMKRLLNGRTSFVIAHRLSTIYDADRILVMDDGDIVETGNHEELLANNGVYADIYRSQFALAAA
jgi:ATP-binding cassette subfamily B protein